MATLLQRRQLLVAGGALVIAGGAFAAMPRRSVVDFTNSHLEDLVPLRLAAWVGGADPNVVPASVDNSIDDGQTLTRRYLGEGVAPIMLVVSYHGPQSPDLKVHRPETCYAVAGFESGQPNTLQVALSATYDVPAVAFTATRSDRIETVLYWTRVGRRFPQTLKDQRIDFLLEALRGVRADGLLMRASTIGADRSSSLRELQSFAAALVHSATPAGRTLLLGPESGRAA